MSSRTAQERQRRCISEAVHVLDKYKITKGCCDCGFNEFPESLHFDHVDPQTKRRALGWRDDRSKLISRARLLAYIDHVDRYCVVRCANCHAHRTQIEKQWMVRRDSPQPYDWQDTLPQDPGEIPLQAATGRRTA